MKTEVIMKRDLDGHLVRQNHKTKMFNANDLIDAGNRVRLGNGLGSKSLQHYFATDDYKEFEKALLWEMPPEEIKKASRGANGGTWVHPLVFMDIAMWILPEFKVKALKWLTDGLLISRDESGESFKSVMISLKANYPDALQDAKDYQEIAHRISHACGVRGKDKWETASEEQLKLRNKIHEKIIDWAGEKPTLQECVSTAIRKSLKD